MCAHKDNKPLSSQCTNKNWLTEQLKLAQLRDNHDSNGNGGGRGVRGDAMSIDCKIIKCTFKSCIVIWHHYCWNKNHQSPLAPSLYQPEIILYRTPILRSNCLEHLVVGQLITVICCYSWHVCTQSTRPHLTLPQRSYPMVSNGKWDLKNVIM